MMREQTQRSIMEVALSYERILADAMPLLVMTADPDGTVTFFNRAWFEFTGQEPFERDVTGEWRRYIHSEDIARVASDWADGVAHNRDFIDMEYRLLEAASGTYRWVKARATAVRDESGNVIQWIGTAMDVDDARRAHNRITEVADAYQSASLPDVPPALNGLRFSTAYRASARHLTACGDWYDAFPLSEGRTALCVGDVTGHGLEAATLMAKYRMSVRAIAIRAALLHSGGPESILRSVEETIAMESPRANATAFFGVVSADRRELRWSNAGHPPPLLVRADGRAEWLSALETPLGWRFEIERTTATTSLAGAKTLVLYTDGLIESSRNVIHGMEQLRELVIAGSDESNLAAHILVDWAPAPLEDDVAILAISF